MSLLVIVDNLLFCLCLDHAYSDPLGPAVERPKTAATRRKEEDTFEDEELGIDLLPE